jgi:hypothetical protein
VATSTVFTGPPRIESARVGVVTVKVAVAVASEFPSVAVSVFEPVGAVTGTANVHANPPVALAVIVPADAAPELQELYEPMPIEPNTIVTVPPKVNPPPSATSAVPTGPPTIESVSVGVVTVKVAVAVAKEFPSVAVTVFAPVGAAAGTANVHANAPPEVVVIVPATADPAAHEL